MSDWKQRRAEYLLKTGRLEEIRAEGLEPHLGFEPGELEDHRDRAQIHILKPRRKLAEKRKETDAPTN